MAHPQSSPRGYFAKKRIDVSSQALTYNSTALILGGGVRLNDKANGQLTSNSTGVNFPGAAFLSGQATGGKVTANSTGVIVASAVFVSGQTTKGKISANSTAILLPSTGFQMASLTTLKITSNSTGILIGSKYISANSTGNTTT